MHKTVPLLLSTLALTVAAAGCGQSTPEKHTDAAAQLCAHLTPQEEAGRGGQEHCEELALSNAEDCKTLPAKELRSRYGTTARCEEEALKE